MNYRRIVITASILWSLLVPCSEVRGQQGTPSPMADPLGAAVAVQGDSALLAVLRLRLAGMSSTGSAVTISASTDGSIRFDYGSPPQRSYVNTPNGAFEVVNGQAPEIKPGHVGVFAQLDMLSVFGIKRFAQPGIQRTEPRSSVVAGRPSVHVTAVNNETKTFFKRTLADGVDVQVDQATGVVLEILRKHYSETSLDVPFIAGFRFSDYRTVQGIFLPYRIDRVMDGSVRETINLDTIEINPAFPTDLFRIPELRR